MQHVLLPTLAKMGIQVRLYEGKFGRAVATALKDVRELKVYDRNNGLVEVLAVAQEGA